MSLEGERLLVVMVTGLSSLAWTKDSDHARPIRALIRKSLPVSTASRTPIVQQLCDDGNSLSPPVSLGCTGIVFADDGSSHYTPLCI